jgi:hypothetical protein
LADRLKSGPGALQAEDRERCAIPWIGHADVWHRHGRCPCREENVTDADTLNIETIDATGATGNRSGANWLKACEINDIGSVTGASIVSGPRSFAANVTNGLSASVGCTTGGTDGACFTGAATALAPAMTRVIDFPGTGLNFAASHLKVQFLRDAGQNKATGDLLWRKIPPIPEPETYAMMLAGMGLVGVIARRRRAEQAKD